ncbi:hypothetical protein FJ366_02015 [Candidatus Dependentiae bacterium]|nr:hypothetical protein [Candidatus Dependentiae bacterium]
MNKKIFLAAVLFVGLNVCATFTRQQLISMTISLQEKIGASGISDAGMRMDFSSALSRVDLCLQNKNVSSEALASCAEQLEVFVRDCVSKDEAAEFCRNVNKFITELRSFNLANSPRRSSASSSDVAASSAELDSFDAASSSPKSEIWEEFSSLQDDDDGFTPAEITLLEKCGVDVVFLTHLLSGVYNNQLCVIGRLQTSDVSRCTSKELFDLRVQCDEVNKKIKSERHLKYLFDEMVAIINAIDDALLSV